jgi:DNA-binding beta-propeller fold protein YncE
MTVAYDAKTGARLWMASYRGGTGERTEESIAVSPDGATVFVAGSQLDSTEIGYNTIAYNAATGTRQWSDRIPQGQVFGIAVTPDDSRLVVTGTLGPFGSPTDDYGTVAYNLTP